MALPYEYAAVEQQEYSRHIATRNGTAYDVYKLIEVARMLPEETVALELFQQLKDERQCWTDLNDHWLGPGNILALAEKYDCCWEAMVLANLDWAPHVLQVRDAQYDRYPLLVVGESHVIDGMHRLTKAWLDRTMTIKIKRFAELPHEALIIGENF